MDDKLKNNRLSDDDLEKVNGGVDFFKDDPGGQMVLDGICPNCYKKSGGVITGKIFSKLDGYLCRICLTRYRIKDQY